MSEHNDAVLLYHNPETTAHELLVDSQRRTDVAVQQRVMSLMEENPGATIRQVTRSELLRCSEMARQLSEQGEKGLRLEDIKKEVSSRQGDILNYFMVAKDIGASDIHCTTLPGLTRIEMRVSPGRSIPASVTMTRLRMRIAGRRKARKTTRGRW